jgi:transposase-like protein
MRKVRRIRKAGQGPKTIGEQLRAAPVSAAAIDTKVTLIQALIPLGLLHVEETLKQEVEQLAGARYAREGGEPGVVRYGKQPGSIYLADQKLGIEVPRVRNLHHNREIALRTYQQLQQPRAADQGVLQRILTGLSCREYERCAEAVPQAFGLSASTVSRRFIRASARKLQELNERSLKKYDFVALFLDGKTFADDTMVVALGVTLKGEKVVLGFVQTSTENGKTCGEFLEGLKARGLRYDQGLLVILDGGKGLHAAVEKVFDKAAAIQRCQWHKRENVMAYLGAGHQTAMRRKLQAAYNQATYEEAKTALKKLRSELSEINLSAVASLDEGFEETLTLHRLGLFEELGVSFKTTNCLESINGLIEQRTGKIDYWKNSDQKHRWLASALLDIEPRLRRVRGYKHLPALRRALQAHKKEAAQQLKGRKAA